MHICSWNFGTIYILQMQGGLRIVGSTFRQENWWTCSTIESLSSSGSHKRSTRFLGELNWSNVFHWGWNFVFSCTSLPSNLMILNLKDY